MIVTADYHLGINNYGIDRTTDVFETVDRIISYTVRNKKNFFIHLGDFSHSHNPTPEIIALMINLCNRLEMNKIESYIISGNHDIKGSHSSLSPIKEVGYSYVHIIDTPRIIDTWYLDKYKLKFLFLPHVTRQLVIKSNREKIETITEKSKEAMEKIKALKDVTNFINECAEEILEDVESNNFNLCFCFSHLNVEGAVLGTEEFMIKGQKESLPECLVTCEKIKYLFNGHMHKKQVVNNKIIIPGSIQKFDFGELKDKKSFVEVDLERLINV